MSRFRAVITVKAALMRLLLLIAGTPSQIGKTQLNGKLIQPVRGAIPDPSPVEGPNPNGCGSENTLDDFDRTATWIDFNVTAANITFYNALNKRIANLVVYHGCDTPEITVIENNVNFVAMRRVDENKRVKQSFAVTAKWTSLDEPSLYDAPAGIFTV
jgi:hypothetical protein